jgi:hypothetical protein
MFLAFSISSLPQVSWLRAAPYLDEEQFPKGPVHFTISCFPMLPRAKVAMDKRRRLGLR